MTYKFFIPTPNTLDELKAMYRKLAMMHHPDRGGNTATMQQINAEHDNIFEVLKSQQFQSTLPMRGATVKDLISELSPDISIHAPHAGSDRPFLYLNCAFVYFNPRSPCGERL